MADPTVRQILSELAKPDPDKLAGVNGTILFDVTGDAPAQYTLVLADGKAELQEGAVEAPDMTLSVRSEDLIAIGKDELKPMHALMRGKIKISGNMALALHLKSMIS
jgi:putative sterol carrier protein